MVINDHSKSEEVYKQTEEYLQNHDELRDKILKHLLAFNEATILVPQNFKNFGSGHFFPFSESYYELENSFELCKLGFYRHSLFALRCVLELAVLGLYFDKDDQAHIDIQNWLKAKEPTPYFRPILNRLFELENFRQFDKLQNIQREIEKISSLLNNYVHTRGYPYSTSAQSLSNFNQFNEKSLLRYISHMERTIKKVVTMILLKYPIGMQDLPIWQKFGLDPPMGGYPCEISRETYLTILDEDTKEALQKISDNDLSVQSIVDSIKNMPDLTEEELQQQINEYSEFLQQRNV